MSDAIKELSEQTFEGQISSGTTLVDFWAPWCGPCKMQLPILEEVAADLGDAVTVAKVNVDDDPALAAKFGIRSIPSLIVFKDGEAKQQFVGLQDKDTLVGAIQSA